MTHPTAEQMVDFYYGDAPQWASHVDGCEACQAEYESLRKAMTSLVVGVPEPAADFETRLWRNIRPALNRDRKGTDGREKWFVMMGSIAAMLVVAFLAGRASKPAPPQNQKVELARIPVLVVAVGDHLERLEAVLQELENTSTARKGAVDISFEQRSAEELLDSNRLYRQTAVASGDLATANVLEDLELALLEIAHQPDTVSPAQLEDLRHSMAERGILFKARVLGSRLKEEETQAEKENRL